MSTILNSIPPHLSNLFSYTYRFIKLNNQKIFDRILISISRNGHKNDPLNNLHSISEVVIWTTEYKVYPKDTSQVVKTISRINGLSVYLKMSTIRL